ncbi:MAG: hypothetical protein ABFS19_10030 [Thermodesulfobacteriota bacterium]
MSDQISITTDESLHFATFEKRLQWPPFGAFEAADLIRLMRSRRSTPPTLLSIVSPALQLKSILTDVVFRKQGA